MSGYQAAARVYAKALFDLALQSQVLGSISDDLHAVQEAVGGLDPELRAFFYLPLLRRADKRKILDMTFGGKVSRPVLGPIFRCNDKCRV